MLEQKSLDTDILVIGSGIAGMIAAIEARKSGAEVAIVTKTGLGKDSSTSRARTFGARSGERPVNAYIPGRDLEPGKYMEDEALVSTLAQEGARQIQNLISLGVPMLQVQPDGKYDTNLETWRPKGSEHTHGGAIVLDILASVAIKMGVKTVEGCNVVSLLRSGDRVAGASGLLIDGSWLTITARAVILATGGAAGISQITSSSPEVVGNGYAMALHAGLYLKNMEFNGYYAVGLPTPEGRYIHCAPVTLMMENAVLRNDQGEDIVKKHFGITLQEAVPPTDIRFDWLPRAVALEAAHGKVWLDLTKVPAAEWDKLPERNWKQIRQTQVDMKTTPLAIQPMMHHFYGGLITDTSLRTSLQGLYGAGEVVAGWRSERGMGNLPCCLVMGAISARTAAADILGVMPSAKKAPDEGLAQAQEMLARNGKVKGDEICKEIRRIMFRHNNPVKSQSSLDEGLKGLASLGKHLGDLKSETPQDMKDGLQARAMLLTAEAMLKSARFRTESRGPHYRSDFPERDDKNWLRPVLVSYDAKNHEVRAERGEEIS